MKSLLYLGQAGRQHWCRDGNVWRLADRVVGGYAWVVTDFPEEGLSEAKTPRLMGSDRVSFVQRQLEGRFPDSAYRSSVAAARSSDLLERLVPTRHLLFGIDAGPRLDAELDAIGVPVAGVWPMSMLLATLGAERSLPPNLFVVLPGPGALRIVFLKERTPVLTRLTLTPSEPKAQVDEITRTLRHLENTQGLPRGQEQSVLLLADPRDYEALMTASRLRLVQLPKFEKQPPTDWRLPIFDLALQNVPGQVAPITRRGNYLSARLGRAARYLSGMIAVVGLAAAAGNLSAILSLISQRQSIAESVQEMNARVAAVDADIARFGVSPELVRNAIAVHQREIASVPDLESSLRLIAAAIASDPGLRLTDFQARILLPSGSTCGLDLASEDGSQRPEAKSPEVAKRRVEIGFEISVPGTYGPRDRAQTLRMVSGSLEAAAGSMLWIDANKDLASGSLRGGTVVGTATRLAWCLTMPGVSADTASTKEPVKS
jgi:hypothetical protein